jgi:ethanolamine utilization protein EutN
MTLAKVIGTMVSTIKHPAFNNLKLFVVQPIDPEGNEVEESFIAADTVQAGVGDTVLILREGSGIRQIFKKEIWPIRSIVIGVVDHVEKGSWLS